MNNKIIVGVILALIVIGGLFYFIQKQYQPSQQSSQQSTQQPEVQVENNTVTIRNLSFNPSVLTVKQGTRVTWINKDSALHKIKSDTFNSSNLNQEDQFEFTFNTKGSFDYICSIHPAMKKKVVVE